MKHIMCIAVITLLCFIGHPLLADPIGTTNEEVQTIAAPILDTILEGFKSNNYAKYSQYFDDTLKEAISEKKFIEVDAQIENSIGSCQTREYLGYLVKTRMTVALWKGRFDKSDDDVLIKLVISKRGDKYLVTGLWFQ